MVYYGVTFGIAAKQQDVVAPYKPAHFNDIPAGLKDPDGYWFTIHSGTLGFFVNVGALGGKPVPKSWKDLLKPDYKGMVGYLDPSSAAVGYAGAVAVNDALGGTLDNFKPGLDWFRAMQKNAPIVPEQYRPTRACSRVRSPSCSITTSTPIARSTPTKRTSRSSSRAKARS